MAVFDSSFDSGFDAPGSGSGSGGHAFDLSFDGAFDSGSGSGGGPVVLETGQATLGLAISVVSPLVFSSGASAIRWSPVVVIGGVDVSARLTGAISVSAAEDSARVASFSVVPGSPAELWDFDGKTLTIDVALFKSTSTAVYRLFTGIIERCEFDPVSRVAQLACRDGWQERPPALLLPMSRRCWAGWPRPRWLWRRGRRRNPIRRHISAPCWIPCQARRRSMRTVCGGRFRGRSARRWSRLRPTMCSTIRCAC
jgi:hypothetical protein